MPEHNIVELLSDSGPFAQAIEGFSARDAQQQMAQDVAHTMAEKGKLMVEAGTGTGKTFAYLLPALLADGKCIISTGTKNLQDQLILKDLPRVFSIMKKNKKAALLKGRQNYLCLYRMQQSLTSGQFTRRQTAEQLITVRDWSEKTVEGDLSQAHFLQDDAAVIPFVTSSAENCLGSDCPDFQKCFVAQARRNAIDADLVVVNHHLLMADLVLKEDGFGELLPHADHFILDEAHQLPDVASLFFGQSLSTRKINDLTRDCELAYHSQANDCIELQQFAQQLSKAVADFRLTFEQHEQKDFWQHFIEQESVATTYSTLVSQCQKLAQILEQQSIRSRELENLYQRADELAQVSLSFQEAEPGDQVQWLEIYRKSFTLNTTPLDVAELFQQAIDRYQSASWVFTSATLAVNEDMSHFRERLGWQQVKEVIYPSPFDYAEQALLYLPRYLPNPSHPQFNQALFNHLIPLLTASRGRAFLLFTSHKALEEMAALLAPYREFELFVQGTASKTYLLQQFRQAEQALLLGTYSFWEGVDVAGERLSFVLIDKLPFASPGDPVNKAKIQYLTRQGKNPFQEFQIPEAIIALKQGAGRLIRDPKDQGVLLLADPRVCGREYGKNFVQNLPPMTRTRDFDWVKEYLENL